MSTWHGSGCHRSCSWVYSVSTVQLPTGNASGSIRLASNQTCRPGVLVMAGDSDMTDILVEEAGSLLVPDGDGGSHLAAGLATKTS